MKSSSFDEIVNNYLCLKQIVSHLQCEHFLYMSREEMKLEKEAIINELMIDASFKLLAKFEAEIRTDYNQTIKSKKKDNLSKEYLRLCHELREQYKEYNKPLISFCRKVRFDNILREIKLYFQSTGNLLHQECSNISGHLHFRHWYAHGRYFTRHVPIPEPEALELVCSDIVREVISRTA